MGGDNLFRPIPGYEGYAISALGELLCLASGKLLNWYVTKPQPKKRITGGYRIRSIKTPEGKSVHLLRHRAVCLAFKPTDDVEKILVNHINGIPGDDRLENLEWVTYSENTQHAYDNGLHPLKVRKVVMLELESGRETYFNSIVECYKAIGKDENFMTRRLADKNQRRRFPDGLRFKYDDGKPWPELEGEFTNSKRSKFVMARDVFTGEINLFESVSSAAGFYAVTPGAITDHIRRNSISTLSGSIFREASNNIVWPKHTDLQLELFRKYPTNAPRGVLVTWVELDTTKLFFSVDEAAEALGKDRLVISRLCVSGKTHFRDNIKCDYVYPDKEM